MPVKLANVCAGIVRFVNAEPSIAGKAPVSVVAFSVPLTPSTSNVLSSPNTLPSTSPSSVPT